MSARTGSYVSGEGLEGAQDRDRLWPAGHTPPGSGRSADERAHAKREPRRDAPSGDRVVPPMTVTAAGMALFLDIGDLAARGDFAVPADDASTTKSSEAQKPNETHHALRYLPEQYVYRSAASCVNAASVTHIGIARMLN